MKIPDYFYLLSLESLDLSKFFSGPLNFERSRVTCTFTCTNVYTVSEITLNFHFFFQFSVPDDERMLKKAGEAVEGFKDIVFPSGYEPGAKKRVIIIGILQ